jgi:hypothetical protein
LIRGLVACCDIHDQYKLTLKPTFWFAIVNFLPAKTSGVVPVLDKLDEATDILVPNVWLAKTVATEWEWELLVLAVRSVAFDAELEPYHP